MRVVLHTCLFATAVSLTIPGASGGDSDRPTVSEAGKSNAISPSDAAEIESLREGLRLRPLLDGCSRPLDLIGSLAERPFWTKVLPLGKEQAAAITRLNDLVQQALDDSIVADAEFPADDLASYQAYIARGDKRRQESIRHAQRLVSVGLLDEPQAAFVIGRVLTNRSPSYSLGDENVQALLGMTNGQKEKLEWMWSNWDHRKDLWKVNSVDPQKQEKIAAAMAANETLTGEADAAALRILTKSQLDEWLRLAVKRKLPADPPDLPTRSEARAAPAGGEGLSQNFAKMVRAADGLGLSADQKRQLHDLQEVTRQGLLWISLRNPEDPNLPDDARKAEADRVSRIRETLVMHAENVALLGILTQEQAFVFMQLC